MRIIPTRVGTSFPRLYSLRQQRDHPHACGDKYTLGFPIFTRGGSSPRVWGQESPFKNDKMPLRIIPTRVGTSVARSFQQPVERDHPHACGDKPSIIPRTPPTIGSSPRVWGQDRAADVLCEISRIIPTRVGTRWCRFRAVS